MLSKLIAILVGGGVMIFKTLTNDKDFNNEVQMSKMRHPY